MWRSWSKSPVRIHNTSSAAAAAASSPSTSTANFSCSTFKDIQNLFTDDSDSPVSKKPSVFHRVRVATATIRNRPPRLDHSYSAPKLIHEPEPEPEPNARHTDSSAELSLATTTTSEPQPTRETSETPIATTSEPVNNVDSVGLLEPSDETVTTTSSPSISIPGADKRIVVYFTSLRVVRSTFEACRTVRSILRGFRVSIDERDLAMDSGFLVELQGILGEIKLSLPRVFIGGRYIGGADEIRQLNETGELKKFVDGLPPAEPGVCDVCGGYRFILCDDCNGSHKLYFEKNGFRSCTACNENGLIRCPSCLCAPF